MIPLLLCTFHAISSLHSNLLSAFSALAFSALTLLVDAARGYLSAARCRLFAYGPADATASQNPIISCLIQLQTNFTFLVFAYPGCPGIEAIKWVCAQ